MINLKSLAGNSVPVQVRPRAPYPISIVFTNKIENKMSV